MSRYPMLYSKTTEYAIRALAYLAATDNAGGVRSIGHAIKVPPAYVSKIFQGLVKAKILISKRGATGGYSLIKDPSLLYLMDIVEAVDGGSYAQLKECVMGLSQCSNDAPCPLHHIWTNARLEMEEKLRKTSLVDVVQTMHLKKFTKQKKMRLSKNMRRVFGLGG